MRARWEHLLVPSFVVSFLLLAASQTLFLKGSLSMDLGLGRLSETLGLENYKVLFTDEFYLHSLWVTVKVSTLATLSTLALGFPVAYVIARMRSRSTP